jgi:O-antigen ligase
MVWVFLAISAIYIIGTLVPPMRPYVFRGFQRAVLDSLFWTWFSALAFSQALLNKRLHMFWRGSLGALALATLYITFVIKQTWTSGWFPAAVAIMVILLLARPKLSIVAAFVAGILLLIRAQAASSFLMAGDNEYSLLTRLEAWGIMFEIIKLNPLFGVGPANYYFYTPFFSILGYFVKFNSHNNYIDILAQTGLVGLGLFAWFTVELGRVSWWLRSRLPEGFLKAYLYGAIGGLAGTLVAGMFGDWVLPFVYNIGMEGFRSSGLAWLFLGAIVMLEQKVRNNEIGPTD